MIYQINFAVSILQTESIIKYLSNCKILQTENINLKYYNLLRQTDIGRRQKNAETYH